MPCRASSSSSMKKLPVVVARVAGEDEVGRVGQDLRRAALADVDARDHLQRRGGDRGARPQAVDGDAVRANSAAWPSVHMLMPYLAIV